MKIFRALDLLMASGIVGYRPVFVDHIALVGSIIRLRTAMSITDPARQWSTALVYDHIVTDQIEYAKTFIVDCQPRVPARDAVGTQRRRLRGLGRETK